MVKMKNRPHSFDELRLDKERLKMQIREKEMSIKYGLKDLVSSLTPQQLKNDMVSFLVTNPRVAFKAGYLLFSLLAGRRTLKSRRKKRS